MAFQDKEGKIVLHSWGRFRVEMQVTVCDVGDLLTWRTTGGTEGVVVATASTAACAVALQPGKAGEMIWCALAAELKAPPTTSTTGGAVTQGYFSDTSAADALALIGDPLYCDAAGKMKTAASTTGQVIAHIVDQDRILVVPANYLVTDDLTLSGGLNVIGTCTFNGDITLGDGENLTLTKGNIRITEKDFNIKAGDCTMTAGDLTMTAGNLTVTAGTIKQVRVTNKTATCTLTDAEQGIINCAIAATATMTLPEAAVGKEFTIIHFSGAEYLNVNAAAGDKICDPSDGAAHLRLRDDKGLDCLITLHAINDANWYVTEMQGDWVGA